MNTTKLLAIAAIGAAVALLITTDKGKELREDFMDNAGEWKEKLGKLANRSAGELSDLKDVLSKQIAGLSDDARARISKILDEGSDTASNLKSKASKAMS